MSARRQAPGRGITKTWWRPGWPLAWLLLLCSSAWAQAPASDFDHLRTGFALGGAHADARCESCHVGGVFKGTPRECEACHVSGARLAKSNVVKGAGHIPTTLACESCHNTRSFGGARVNHAAVAKGKCGTCHDGGHAIGKSSNHLLTATACDSCHSPTGWRPVLAFDHAGIAAGSCASCHNGTQASGRSAAHTPYSQVSALSGEACDACHKAGFRAWTPAKLHTNVGVAAQCATCHMSSKPTNGIHSGQTVCESCHKTAATWAAKVDHGKYTAATDCTGCHSGGGASGKGSAHMPVGTTNCVACHTTSTWKPSRFDHTQGTMT
ncbi:MAG: hypothetical protein IH627_07165, partial [Rubrivivax sp.]|nr:hypothetical protein [Rubrivivax sp.]